MPTTALSVGCDDGQRRIAGDPGWLELMRPAPLDEPSGEGLDKGSTTGHNGIEATDTRIGGAQTGEARGSVPTTY